MSPNPISEAPEGAAGTFLLTVIGRKAQTAKRSCFVEQEAPPGYKRV